MKLKCLLFCLIFLVNAKIQAQETENKAFQIAQKISFYLPSTNNAQLFNSTSRFIKLGLKGTEADISYLVQSFDRYIYSDLDMIPKVELAEKEGDIQFYKFYLTDLADAHDVEKMLQMYKIETFYWNNILCKIDDFSSKIYAAQKNIK